MLKSLDIDLVRYATDAASGGKPPEAETRPENSTGDGEQGKQAQERTFTQAEVNAILAREKEAKRAADEKARKEAEDRQLAEQAKWQDLADKRKSEITELQEKLAAAITKDDQIKRLTAALEAHRDAQFGSVPDHIRELLAGRDVVEQIEWLAKHGGSVKSDAVTPTPAKGTPQPKLGKRVTSETTPADLIAAKRAQLGIQ